jgi:hypothetical protein
MSAITLFEEKQVRRAWNAAEEKWYFAIVDVINILTNSPNPQVYWRVMKKRLMAEGNETVTNCHGLKMTDAGGLSHEVHARQVYGGQPSRLSWSAAVSAAVPMVSTSSAPEPRQSEQARRPFYNTAGTAMLRFGSHFTRMPKGADRSANSPFGRPFRALVPGCNLFPGRCPGLTYLAPLVLKILRISHPHWGNADLARTQ